MQSSVYYFNNDKKSFWDNLNVFLLQCHSIRFGLLIGRYWNDLDSLSQWLIVNQWCHNGQKDIFYCPIKPEKQRCSYEAYLSVAMNNCVEWTDDMNLYLSFVLDLLSPATWLERYVFWRIWPLTYLLLRFGLKNVEVCCFSRMLF